SIYRPLHHRALPSFPTRRSSDLQGLTEAFDLHPLAVEDASHGHQRPKLERYGQALFLAAHPISYKDGSEKLVIAEVHAFIGPNRSEEHTSELQSRFDLVCRLLLE